MTESEDVFCAFRDHETVYGWGVRHLPTGRVFALVGDKGAAFGLAAALNGDDVKAKSYFSYAKSIPDDYFKRFPNG